MPYINTLQARLTARESQWAACGIEMSPDKSFVSDNRTFEGQTKNIV